MPAVSPTSVWSQHIDAVRDTFSNLTAFRSFTNTSTVPLAKARVYTQSIPGNGRIQPYMIFIEKSFVYRCAKSGAFIQDCEADLLFEMMKNDTVGNPDDYYALANPVGLIIEELVALGGVANVNGYINEPDCRLITAPHWGSEAEEAAEGRWLSCRIGMSWKTG